SPGLPLEPDEPPLLELPLEPPLEPPPLEPPLEPPLDPPLLDPDAVASPPSSVGRLPSFLKLSQAPAMATTTRVTARTSSGERESMVAQCVRRPPSCQTVCAQSTS